ncbi:MAG: glycosyltransferase [Asticcacaulis sp.]|uniref:glycosyltransferase n=1 Tax=Asticcacaulis sp. TaxID=1872648 RepID=UPI003F7B5626
MSIGSAVSSIMTSLRQGAVRNLLWFAQDLIGQGPRSAMRLRRSYNAIARSNVFDPDFYQDQLDLDISDHARLLRHYVTEGYRHGLNPSPGFSTTKYLDFYPDVRQTGIDPLSHFLLYGRAEHRIALPTSVSTGSVIFLNAVPLENRDRHAWRMEQTPLLDPSELGPYDHRPDDAVPAEGRRGEAFMERHRLLSAQPDFAGAVVALNQKITSGKNERIQGGRPDVSIVIPVYGQLAYTLNCLDALLRHASRYRFEILIADDASPDESEQWLSQVQGISYHRYTQNCGFIGNCNRAAEHARGAWLVMLNNDTRVVRGWLDGLIDSFSRFPKVGLVGSKIFYPGGRLQEAGGIIWKDGSGWNYGRDDDPNRPRYCYARQVDYVSGCSIAVPSQLWREVGGFDSHFGPAYYEDVDLAFRLKKAGHEVWFQPESRIIHYEGKTSGIDTSAGVKAYQTRNQEKFLERWGEELAGHRTNGEEPWFEKDRQVSKRVLIIDAVTPTPWQDAGSQAVVNLFRYYQALGYQVSFVSENFLYERRAVSEMQAMGVQCFYAPYETFLPSLLSTYGEQFDTIHVIRADVAAKSIELIRTLTPHARAVFQNCDLHYLRLERQAEVEKNQVLATEAKAMKVRELQLSRDYDFTITHSEAERQILSAELPERDIVVMPLIETIVEADAAFDERLDFMFLGGYGHPPNVDAVRWLLKDIWPELSVKCPQARLLLVGANPPEEILRAASDRIIVTGLVDDLDPWFARTRAFLAALRYGAGSKGKVLSAMAHGVPVVATDIAAEGMTLHDGESVFRANTAQEIIDRAVAVYNLGESGWDKAAQSARAYILKHHGFNANVETLQSALLKHRPEVKNISH